MVRSKLPAKKFGAGSIGRNRVCKLNSVRYFHFPFHFTFIGDGTENENIYATLRNIKLEQKITHIKCTKEIEKNISRSDLYLQGTHTEGCPNALLESCAVSTPVLDYDAS